MLPADQLIQHAPDAPDVAFVAVVRVFENLWRHVEGRADLRFRQVDRRVEHLGDAEIAQFNNAVLEGCDVLLVRPGAPEPVERRLVRLVHEKNILRLQVAVQDGAVVQEMHGRDDLDEPLEDQRLLGGTGDAAVSPDFLEVRVNIAGVAVLHQNTQMPGLAVLGRGFGDEILLVRDDVGMVHGLQQSNLRWRRSCYAPNSLPMFFDTLLSTVVVCC